MRQRTPIAGAYTMGWKAGYRAASRTRLNLSAPYKSADLEAQAAEESRGYMEDLMERHSTLTPRAGVHLFFSYFDGYLDGAVLSAARRAACI